MHLLTAAVLQASVDSSVQHLEKINVVSTRIRAADSLSIRRTEEWIGEVDDVNIAYLLQPAVAHIPEAGSQIMVQGESPFDNVFLLRDVPLLSIGHFGGSTFADRSAVPAAAPLTMRFINENIAGRYSGASGSITTIDPGIIMNDSGLIQRPQLLINYGNIGQDLSFAAPLRKNRDHYQLTLRVADALQINAIAKLNYRSTIQAGYVLPYRYNDAQLLGEQMLGKIRVRQLVWLSLDTYADPYSAQFPWGAIAVSLGDSADSWHATIGGSHQFSYDGKRIGPFLPVKEVTRDGLTITIKPREYRIGDGKISTGVFIERGQWNGAVNRHPDAYYLNTVSEPDISRSGITGMGSLQLNYESASSFFLYGIDLNGGGFFAGKRAFLDPGIWAKYPYERGTLQISLGIVSSQPDIRFLPTSDYASTVVRTYNGSISMNRTLLSWLSGSLIGYGKLKDNVPLPASDVSDPTWNSLHDAKLLAYGAGAKLDAKIGKSFSLTITQSIGKSSVLKNGKRETYPWDVPWSNTTTLSKSFIDGRLTVYCIGAFSAGLPYRTPMEVGDSIVWSGPWRRMPTYKCIDFKLQYCQQIKHHRFLKQLDGYILLDNIIDGGSFFEPTWSGGFNAREYFWDAHLAPHQISLKPFGGFIGMRTWFRL